MKLAEIKEKYGNIKLEPLSYIEYVFSFRGEIDDGSRIYVNCGGEARDIREMAINFKDATINTLRAFYLIIIKKDGKTLAYWSGD